MKELWKGREKKAKHGYTSLRDIIVYESWLISWVWQHMFTKAISTYNVPISPNLLLITDTVVSPEFSSIQYFHPHIPLEPHGFPWLLSEMSSASAHLIWTLYGKSIWLVKSFIFCIQVSSLVGWLHSNSNILEKDRSCHRHNCSFKNHQNGREAQIYPVERISLPCAQSLPL